VPATKLAMAKFARFLLSGAGGLVVLVHVLHHWQELSWTGIQSTGKLRGKRRHACLAHQAISRSTHNSFQEELYDRIALSGSDSEPHISSVAAPVEHLQRIAHTCSLKPQSFVLDVGTGTGVMLPYYEECGASLTRITGVDLSEGMLSHARRLHPTATFLKSDICAFEDPQGRLYDCVVFNSCMQNLHDEGHALRHIAEELVVGGGLVVISEPRGKAAVETIRENHPRAVLHSLKSRTELQKLASRLGGSSNSGVDSWSSPLLSVESVEDEEDYYCAVLRRSCADF